MMLLPYEKFQIETLLSPIEARKRIETIVVAKPLFATRFFNSLDNMFKKSGADQFTGKVDDQGFQLRRVIYYRNSFLPVVKGKFEQGSVGTKVDVTMTLHPAVTVFMFIWLAGLGIIGVIPMFVIFLNDFRPELLIPAGMFLLGWLMVQFGFLFEARKAKKIISQLFPNADKNAPTVDRAHDSLKFDQSSTK